MSFLCCSFAKTGFFLMSHQVCTLKASVNLHWKRRHRELLKALWFYTKVKKEVLPFLLAACSWASMKVFSLKSCDPMGSNRVTMKKGGM